MTDRIIRLRGDDHHEAQLNLPWYATGRLDPAEHAQVDAHLRVCAQCQEDLKFERWLTAEVPQLPITADQAWSALQGRLRPRDVARRPGLRERLGQRLGGLLPSGGGGWSGWAVAAQFAVIVALAAALVLPHRQAPEYRALGAADAPGAGDVLVMFRPATPEAEFRRMLGAGGARLVDGPTPAGAYVIRAPATRRAAIVAQLRREGDVLLAEPIDPGLAP